MLGSDTDVAPVEIPTYESASALVPLPACSLTTETIVDPKLFTTTENCVLSGRSVSLFGTSAKLDAAASAETVRRATQLPSENL